EADLAGLVDDAHGAAAQLAEDFVAGHGGGFGQGLDFAPPAQRARPGGKGEPPGGGGGPFGAKTPGGLGGGGGGGAPPQAGGGGGGGRAFQCQRRVGAWRRCVVVNEGVIPLVLGPFDREGLVRGTGRRGGAVEGQRLVGGRSVGREGQRPIRGGRRRGGHL